MQYHFHGLDPNRVVNHAYNVASYLFDRNAPVRSGETIDGLLNGNMSQEVQWRCQYEDALIQPVRCVMDICPGEYAAGNREDEMCIRDRMMYEEDDKWYTENSLWRWLPPV